MRGNVLWERFERNAHRTFGEAAAKWLKASEAKDKRRQAICVESLIPYIGHLKLFEVDGDALEQFKDDRKVGKGVFESPVMVGTINKELRTCIAILNAACKQWRWIPSAPLIKQLKGAVKVAHPLSWVEKEAVFHYMDSHYSEGAALFALNTGVRKGELVNLRWTQMVPIPALDSFLFLLTETKNGQQRAVICNSEARRAVDRQRGNGSRYVFTNRQGERLGDLQRPWRVGWEKAGLPMDAHILRGWNTLRHTFASWLRAVGVRDEDRDKLMGHHSSDIRHNYAQPDIVRLSDAAELITDGDKLRQSVILRLVNVTA